MSDPREYNRYWAPETPRGAVRRYVDTLHVRTTARDIELAIREAIKRSSDAPKYTPRIIRQTIEYALERHLENLRLYQSVTKGNLK